MWFFVLKFMALLCPCRWAALLEGLVCHGFSPAKQASKEMAPIRCRGVRVAHAGWGAPVMLWGLHASGAAQTRGNTFLLFQAEVFTLFLASERGRPGRVLIPLVLQVLRYCRA